MTRATAAAGSTSAGKVDQFAGPTPLVARLKASSKNGDGDVLYRWRFDDGTSSTEQEVTHTFPRAGYYQVILDARDESGDNDRETFLFGAWPPRSGPRRSARRSRRRARCRPRRCSRTHGRAAGGTARASAPPGTRADPGLSLAAGSGRRLVLLERGVEHAGLLATVPAALAQRL